MLGGGVDAATLVAALGAGPPPPECRVLELYFFVSVNTSLYLRAASHRHRGCRQSRSVGSPRVDL